MTIHEIEVKNALYKHNKPGLPYHYDLNIYRGCSHQCAFCYAFKTRGASYNAPKQNELFVKTNIAEALERQLKSPTWKGDIINLGGICDSYQSTEETYQLVPKILKVMIKYKNPIIVSTKSDLIVRDRELLDQLSRLTYVNVVLCITSAHSYVSEKVEPGATTPKQRFEALKALKGISACRALHFFPILPLLSDDDESLETIVKWAQTAEVDYMMSALLYMTGAIKKNYMAMIEKHFPDKLEAYQKLYLKAHADKVYKQKIHEKLAALRKKYNVSNSYQNLMPKKQDTQLSLY